MKNLEAIRTAGQENLNRLVNLGKEQPPEVKTWGVTAGAAAAGGLLMVAGAQGLLAIFATLATLPVSLTVGAIGGGVLGWLYMERQKTANKATAVKATAAGEAPLSDPAPEAVAAEVAAPEAISVAASSESPVGSDATDVIASDSISPSQAGEPLLITPGAVTESQPAAATATEPVDTGLMDIVIAAPPAHQNNLEDIVGVGPVFATRLQAAGIDTFAQLAALNPEQLLEIMAPSRGGHLIDAAAWIEQARQLAASATAQK